MTDRNEILRILKNIPDLPEGAVRAVAVAASGVQITLAVEADADRQEALRQAVVAAVANLGDVGGVTVNFALSEAEKKAEAERAGREL